MMMGATVPLMMSIIAQSDPANRSSFSFLYLANVIGAMAGTVITGLFWWRVRSRLKKRTLG
jgi:hypothetical protein